MAAFAGRAGLANERLGGASARKARLSGKANPETIDEFNKVIAERMMGKTTGDEAMPDITDIDVEDMKAGDGSLPGGLSEDQFKQLAANPEVMTALMNPKVQEIMRDVMTNGPDAVQKYVNDPESRELLESLQVCICSAAVPCAVPVLIRMPPVQGLLKI